MSSPVLRPATPTDASAVAQIWYDGWREAHLAHSPPELVAGRSEASFHRRAADRVTETTVAAVDCEVGGFVMLHDDEVEQVYVAAGHRGSGLAGLLLTEAERLVAAAGHLVAWLAVIPPNTRARRFYERCGWSDEGDFTYPSATADGPVEVVCRRYTKRLD